MTIVTSREAHKRFGEVMDKARREPVTITRNSRPIVVVLSAERYAEIQAIEEKITGKRGSASGILADLPGFGTEEFRKSKQEEIELEEKKFERHSRKSGSQAA